jgi:hypothetical protein
MMKIIKFTLTYSFDEDHQIYTHHPSPARLAAAATHHTPHGARQPFPASAKACVKCATATGSYYM